MLQLHCPAYGVRNLDFFVLTPLAVLGLAVRNHPFCGFAGEWRSHSFENHTDFLLAIEQTI